MAFLILMIFGTLLIASAAVFFSVLGLVQTFSETAIYWGTSIEVAKLILASFLYRFWDSTSKISKAVNIILIVFLMSITSLGIYGHIITSYQEGNLQVENQNIKLETAQDRLVRTREKIESINDRIEDERSRIEDIDEEISRVPDNYVTVRRELIQEREPEKNSIRERIDELFDTREELFKELEEHQEEISVLRIETGEVENKVGPIIFVVETLGATGEKAVFWFVLIIVFSFDPAAVALTIYTNKVSLSLENNKEEEDFVEPSPSPSLTPPSTPDPSVTPQSLSEKADENSYSPNKDELEGFFDNVNRSLEENNKQLKQMQETFAKDKKRKELIDKATK